MHHELLEVSPRKGVLGNAFGTREFLPKERQNTEPAFAGFRCKVHAGRDGEGLGDRSAEQAFYFDL